MEDRPRWTRVAQLKPNEGDRKDPKRGGLDRWPRLMEILQVERNKAQLGLAK